MTIATTAYKLKLRKPVSTKPAVTCPAAALLEDAAAELEDESEAAVPVAKDVTVPVPEVPASASNVEQDDAVEAVLIVPEPEKSQAVDALEFKS